MDKLEKPIYVTKPTLPNFDEFSADMKEIWENGILTNNGPIHERFREQVTSFLGASNVELFTNGHQALEIATKTAFSQGEIITSPFTFVSTTLAIKNAGLTPVFCDVNMADFNVNLESIEGLITDKTVAIMPIHVFGVPVDVYGIEKLAQKHKLKVIYDAAHAFGVTVDGKPISDFGDMSMFSMHATKVFNSVEGGILEFKDPEFFTTLRRAKNFGLDATGYSEGFGTNAKLSEFHSLVGLSNLKNIEDNINKRNRLIEVYKENLKTNNKITFQTSSLNYKHNGSYFPILLESEEMRDNLFDKLQEYNIFSRKYFYPLISEFENFAEFNKKNTPNADIIANQVLVLPLYAELTEDEVQKICQAIAIILQ